MVLSAKSSKTQFSFSSPDAPHFPPLSFRMGVVAARDGARAGYVTGMQMSVPWTHGICACMVP